ncbi:MAG: Dna2/Cas4 domain-containing protein [Bacteroidetes bacterium]|nr:MAG: Dna2/Cas4 domain-containing protein [Bacteroidota bacterium]
MTSGYIEFGDLEALRITGTKVHYLQVCLRKLWLFSRHISLERGHPAVEEGRILHQNAYPGRLRKERWLSTLLRIDYAENGLIVEIKRSQRGTRAARAQLLFYLFALKKYLQWPEGEPFPIEGELRFPRERRKERITLTPQAEEEVLSWIRQIQAIEHSPTPPAVSWKGICARCAYAEFCWG